MLTGADYGQFVPEFERLVDLHGKLRLLLNQSLREAALAGVVVFAGGETVMERAWMLLW